MVSGMSSGKLVGNYLENDETNFRFGESALLTNYNLQKSNYFKPNLYKNWLKKDSESLRQQLNDNVRDNNFDIIREIHYILKKSKNLTQEQKFAYCNSQRFYMKLYLKRISREI
jgi:hypothetical protein